MQHQEAWAFNGGNQPPFRKSVMVEDHFQRGRFSTLSVSNLQIQEKVRTSGRAALIVDKTMGQQCLFGTSRAPKKGPTNQHAIRALAISYRMRKKDADINASSHGAPDVPGCGRSGPTNAKNAQMRNAMTTRYFPKCHRPKRSRRSSKQTAADAAVGESPPGHAQHHSSKPEAGPAGPLPAVLPRNAPPPLGRFCAIPDARGAREASPAGAKRPRRAERVTCYKLHMTQT